VAVGIALGIIVRESLLDAYFTPVAETVYAKEEVIVIPKEVQIE
jgi:hypothetical protein